MKYEKIEDDCASQNILRACLVVEDAVDLCTTGGRVSLSLVQMWHTLIHEWSYDKIEPNTEILF